MQDTDQGRRGESGYTGEFSGWLFNSLSKFVSE